MSYKKNILEKLERIQTQLEKSGATVGILREEIDRLRKENEKLMDRFMAMDFEKFKTYNPEFSVEPVKEQALYDEDESNAGEIFAMPVKR